MAFLQDGYIDPDEARQLYELIGRGSGDLDLVMMIERKGKPIEGESPRKFEDRKPRMVIGGYYWAAHATEAVGKSRIAPKALLVARQSDAATVSIASHLCAQDADLTVLISAFKSGGDLLSTDAQAMFEIKLDEARVHQQILNSGGPWGLPSELIAFSYRTITLQAAPQTATGARGAVRECSFQMR